MDNSLTFFTIPRDSFDGFYGMAMNNAIKSWALLEPKPEIMLFGNTTDIQDAAQRFHCVRKPINCHRKWGIPFINGAIKQAQKHAKNPMLCFANTDMIFFQDIYDAIEAVASTFRKFLIIGRRTRVEIPSPIDFSGDWQNELHDLASEKGRLANDLGIDYWIFKRGLYQNVPPLLIGHRVWHCWLVWDVWRRGIPVINATEAILAVHQDPMGRRGRRVKAGPGFRYNIKAVGVKNAREYNRAARISKTKWVLTKNGEVRKRKRK